MVDKYLSSIQSMGNQEAFEFYYPRVLKRIYKDFQTPSDSYEEVPSTIVDLALHLRMSTNGSSDPWPLSEVAKAVAVLKHRKANWFPTSDNIDDAILEIINSAILIGEEELKRDWDFN